MKVVICGDTHIGAVFGLGKAKDDGGNTRIDDYERTLDNIINYCIEKKADLFVQTGDAFDSRNPSPEHMSVVNKALKRLSVAGIASAVIMGNHDYRRSGNTFTSAISSLAAQDYPNVRIVLEPQVLTLAKGEDTIQVVLLPYRDRKMYDGQNTEEDSLLYEAHAQSLISSCDDSFPIIAIGHNFFKESSYNTYGGLEVLAQVSAFEKCDMVAMGHYHEFKVLKKKDPIAFYTGSMEKLNFGDQGMDKYFVEYDSLEKKVKVLKSPVRELHDGLTDLSMYDIDDFWKSFSEEISGCDFKDKIVRYRISVQGKIAPLIRKADIVKMLYDAGAFYVSKVLFEPVFDRMVRDNSILDKKDNLSMIKAFIESQPFDDDMREKLLSASDSIVS